MADADSLRKAIQKHKEGHQHEAAEIYREILARSPDNVDALHFLGVAEHQLGDSGKALELLARALEIMPDHLDARCNRGNVYKTLGRLDDAEREYRYALRLRPRDPNTLNNLGTVLSERGDVESAASVFREVIDLAPHHAAAWQNFGNALKKLHRVGEAIDAYREAIRLDTQSADSYLRLGTLLYAAGRIDQATDVYRQWSELFPNDPRARHLLTSCTGVSVPARASDDYVRAEFDSFAEDFDSALAGLEYRAPVLVAEELARLLGEPQARLVILDAGCGTGLCAPFLRPRASFLRGVDLSAGMIEKARKRALFDALVVEEITAHLCHHENTYDLIVSADTLVYFGDLTLVVQGSARALRPGGVLVFTVERVSSEAAPSGFRINPHGRYSHTHDYLLRILGEAGMKEPSLREVVLRKEADAWVEGWLVSARLPFEGSRG